MTPRPATVSSTGGVMFFDSYKTVPNAAKFAEQVPAPLDAALGILVSVALSAVLWEFIIPFVWWLAR